jgi:hypothetical protein
MESEGQIVAVRSPERRANAVGSCPENERSIFGKSAKMSFEIRDELDAKRHIENEG